jgi:nucleoside-diphosphate-sugar epimerase
LDPLIGYLLLLEKNIHNLETEKINFGPNSKSLSVEELLAILKTNGGIKTIEIEMNANVNEKESTNLDLDSSLAFEKLGWKAKWSQEISIIATFNWWKMYFYDGHDPSQLCIKDITRMLGEDK